MEHSAESKYQHFKDIALEIARGGSLLAIFSAIRSHLQKLIAHDHTSIVMVSASGDRLVVPVATDIHSGLPVVLDGQELSPSQTILWNVIREGTVLYRPDIARSEPLFPACRTLLKKGLVADLLIPLNAGGKVIGTLNLSSRKTHPYTPEEVADAADVALLVAIAIERVRLMDELVESKRQIEQYTTDLEKTLAERSGELLRAQRRALQNEKLASIGRLGASLGHELRNPLAVMKNIAYFLRLKLSGADEKVRRQIEILDKEVRISDRIIQNLLNFSKSQPPEKVPSDLAAIAREALDEARLPENVAGEVHASAALPVVHVDRTEMLQVFLNLIQNSVKAMPDGGRLDITIEERPASGAGPGCLLAHVADTGKGIKEEDLDRIFEPLFTTHHAGIGLGLSLVRLIMERHGGDVTAVSSPGRGATFTLSLPVGPGEGSKDDLPDGGSE